jgi:predicted nuclease of restriction endonuclease-like RecB superfamily
MLTGKLVRVRFVRNRVIPNYLDVSDPTLHAVAEQLLDLFRGSEGRTRGTLMEDIRDSFGDDPRHIIYQGLAKLLEDRCEFEVVSGHPPEKLREAVFLAAAKHRQKAPPAVLPVTASTPLDDAQQVTVTAVPSVLGPALDRTAVLQEVAAELDTTVEAVEHGLFADLKSEQRLIRFADITAERLLQRYNVALAQAVLLRSTGLEVKIRGEPPQRYRQLLRLVKFHRLVCEVELAETDGCTLRLDGPLSLFTATQKYGLQLALFLPAVLLCRDFHLRAELRWGPQRKAKTFEITADDGLVSHQAEAGMYVPPELAMFAQLFRKKVTDWEIVEETALLPLGDSHWVPDYRLIHRETGRTVYLEVLGFWRRSSVVKHLERLREHAKEPFLLAVSEQLHIDDAELEALPAGIHRFRNMPLPDEVVKLAAQIARLG